jgi:zinc ribbon protein
MDEGHYRKRLFAIVGVLAAALAGGLLFVTFSSAGREMIGGPGSIMGWAVPLVTLFTITAITWLLIMSDARPDDDEARYVSCWSCGHSIMTEWRLCPYCGAELRAWTAPSGSESLDRG